jgi:hypothetical protein
MITKPFFERDSFGAVRRGHAAQVAHQPKATLDDVDACGASQERRERRPRMAPAQVAVQRRSPSAQFLPANSPLTKRSIVSRSRSVQTYSGRFMRPKALPRARRRRLRLYLSWSSKCSFKQPSYLKAPSGSRGVEGHGNKCALIADSGRYELLSRPDSASNTRSSQARDFLSSAGYARSPTLEREPGRS